VSVLTIGVDIGGTNVRAAVVNSKGDDVAREWAASPPDDWPTMREQVLALVAMLRAEHDVAAVGIGAAGMVDRDGVIHYAPNVPGFLGTPVQAEIAAATGLPTVVDNDANAAAWGELTHGAARGVQDALVITLGTGIGGGIVSDGRVLQGAHGFAAEVGHFTVDPDGPLCACGEVGHWEAVASGTALGRMAREAARLGDAPAILKAAGGDPESVRGTHVTEAGRAGAPDALALIDRYAAAVALGFVGLANILDPEIIVVSGGLVEEGDLLLGPVRTFFDGHVEGARYRPTPSIVAAELGGRAGTIGAAAMARALVG
jgi:glucokinase